MSEFQLIKGGSPSPRTATFSWWTPLSKSEQGEDGRKWLQGLTSDASKDLQDERLIQEGMDFGPLLRSGYVNWDHKDGPENIIGEPTEADLRHTKAGIGLWLKSLIYDHPRAQAAWDLVQEVEKSREAGIGHRQIGWSVEGAVLERGGDHRTITKSVIRHMALTHQPVNQRTYAEIAKSFGAIWSGCDDFDPDENDHYAFGSFGAFAKALATGPAASTSSSAPLMLQNLDGRASSVLLKFFGKQCKGRCSREFNGRRKSLAHLVLCAGYPEDDAFELVNDTLDYLG